MSKRFLTLTFLLVFVSVLCAGDFEREFDMPMGKTLEVNIRTGGSITVQGWDKEKVLVKVDSRDNDLEEMIEFDKHSGGLDIDVNNGYGYSSHSLDFSIYVPEKTDIELETMGGSIEINNVEGDFSGKTMGGSIKLSNLKGNVKLTTMGGSITCKNSELDGALKTMGGSLHFQNVVGSVTGTTMGGSVKYLHDSDKKTSGKGSEVTLTTMGGSIKVDEALMGTSVETMGGGIHVKKAKNYVKAKTMGGNIDIDEIDGWVKASTMGGDVTVVMVGNPDTGKRDVDISSMGGDIELTLPKGISADFDIKLTYTKNSSQDYEIKSDFPLEIKKSEDWIYKHGSPRKIITGKSKGKAGKHSIHIETVNGDIVIRER